VVLEVEVEFVGCFEFVVDVLLELAVVVGQLIPLVVFLLFVIVFEHSSQTHHLVFWYDCSFKKKQ